MGFSVCLTVVAIVVAIFFTVVLTVAAVAASLVVSVRAVTGRVKTEFEPLTLGRFVILITIPTSP